MNRLITTICLSTYNVWNLTISLPSKRQPSGFRTVHQGQYRTHRLAELADAQIRARFACRNLIDDTSTIPSQFGDQS